MNENTCTADKGPRPLPQPGARDNPMLSLNLGARDIKSENWITLPKRESPNFTDARPYQVAAGETLYRVFGGSARMTGGYWSPAPPAKTETDAQWRSETAVVLSWNAGTRVAAFTAREPIQSWRGGIAPQHAESADSGKLPGWFLVGGGAQIWIPSYPKWTHASPVETGPTPWSKPSDTAALSMPARLAVVAQASASNSQDPFGQQAHRVVALADSLREIAASIGAKGGDGRSNEDASYLENAANQLVATANSIFTNLVASDEGAGRKQVAAEVGSQAGLSRFIDLEGQWAGADAALNLLDEVVVEAVGLSGSG